MKQVFTENKVDNIDCLPTRTTWNRQAERLLFGVNISSVYVKCITLIDSPFWWSFLNIHGVLHSGSTATLQPGFIKGCPPKKNNKIKITSERSLFIQSTSPLFFQFWQGPSAGCLPYICQSLVLLDTKRGPLLAPVLINSVT